jgi:leucyl-tRNA synthetase
MEHTEKTIYNHNEIEQKWQLQWEEEGLYQTSIQTAKNPYYNLMMYPYPSAEGLHVGNVYAFTGSDMHGRYQRMQGKNVFEPMGFDSGGIHSENFAIKMGVHPRVMTERNIANFTRQLKRIGNMFDWNHSVDAMDPNYYRWTQWVFTQMFKAGLAYKKPSPVTWCPNCKTTVSDEQTEKVARSKKQEVSSRGELPSPSVARTLARCEGGSSPISVGDEDLRPSMDEVTVCERCKTPIERRHMNQWFFKITDYAQRLLENTDHLDWPNKILSTQRNWIGRSEGAVIKFSIFNDQFLKQESNISSPWNQGETSSEARQKGSIEVFTTRPDTLHGCTYLVLAPEHPLVLDLATDTYKDKVQEYLKKSKAKTEQERKIGDKEKTGVFTGAYALNPVNGKKIPIWVADYVLMGYGEGAVMGVPMHDSRDYDFATKYGLSMVKVVEPVEKLKDQDSKIKNEEDCYEGEGILINSNDWNGWKYPQDASRVISWIEQKSIGSKKTTYKLRDWNISRQRYWGPPIPMIYCETCAEEGRSWFSENNISHFPSLVKGGRRPTGLQGELTGDRGNFDGDPIAQAFCFTECTAPG